MSDADVTGQHPRLMPMNRIRVVYDGDPISARVELLVQTDRGEEVHDVPFDSMNLYVDGRGKTRLAVTIGEEHISAQIVGPIDTLAEQKLMSVAKLPRMDERKLADPPPSISCPGRPLDGIPPATRHDWNAHLPWMHSTCSRCGQQMPVITETP